MKTTIKKTSNTRQQKLKRQAIEHPIRRKIMNLLPCSGESLVNELRLDPDVIQQHMTILERAKVIEETNLSVSHN